MSSSVPCFFLTLLVPFHEFLGLDVDFSDGQEAILHNFLSSLFDNLLQFGLFPRALFFWGI